jgi:hypothetical protein
MSAAAAAAGADALCLTEHRYIPQFFAAFRPSTHMVNDVLMKVLLQVPQPAVYIPTIRMSKWPDLFSSTSSRSSATMFMLQSS